MKVIDFKGHHIDEMVDIGAQTWIKYHTNVEELRTYETAGPAMTGTVDGEIIGCAGIYMVHQHRGIAWAVLDMSAKKHFMLIHMAVLTWFRAHKEIPRIEAFVDPFFDNAMKWVRLLGFTKESEKPYFFANGGPAVEWVRYNHPQKETE